MSAQDRDAGRVVARLVVCRPVDRTALQEANAQPVALNDRGRPRGSEIGPPAGVQDADLVESRDCDSEPEHLALHPLEGFLPRELINVCRAPNGSRNRFNLMMNGAVEATTLTEPQPLFPAASSLLT
jgi:hypothetical protein